MAERTWLQGSGDGGLVEREWCWWGDDKGVAEGSGNEGVVTKESQLRRGGKGVTMRVCP